MRIAVIGGGPAGMMAAISAAQAGIETFLFEKNNKLGKKLFITGKGRCNLTNDISPQEFLKNVVSNPKFLYSAINRFTPQDVINFFEQHGCPLKVERGGRVFPLSDHSSDIIKTFEKVLKNYGVNILLGCEVKDISKIADRFEILCGGGQKLDFDRVIIACGGLSYPATGSTGDGYAFAKKFGHTIIETVPGLVSISVKEDVSSLQGLSLKNVTLTAEYENKVAAQLFGEMLFTQTGVSGPIVLSISSRINRLPVNKVKLYIDLKPALDHNKLDDRILRDFAKYQNKLFKNALDDLLPKSLIPEIIKRSGIDENQRVNAITRAQRQNLINALKRFELNVKSLDGFERAIITSGGVNTKEINPSTLESKLVKGLYFAGEIIDVDAYTGGYNIQIAISTGYLAGVSVARVL
ncbi:MAG TPA: NAD(P)/FAD-dependent oxidoreductase [Clostridia bacterium]